MKTFYDMIPFLHFLTNDSLTCDLFRSWLEPTNGASDNDLGICEEFTWKEMADFIHFIKMAGMNLKFRSWILIATIFRNIINKSAYKQFHMDSSNKCQ